MYGSLTCRVRLPVSTLTEVLIQMFELSPNTRLTRAALSNALTQAGFPIAVGTLARLAYERKGPPYTIVAGRAQYVWGDALPWAESRREKSHPYKGRSVSRRRTK